MDIWGKAVLEEYSGEEDWCAQRQDGRNCRVCFDNYQVWSDWSPGAVKVSGNQCGKVKAESQPVEVEVHSEGHGRKLLEASWVEGDMTRTVFPEGDRE